MADNDNKIKYGICDVYYAVATIAADGSAEYAAPKALRGAKSLSMSAEGSTDNFYADNIVYYTGVSNTGYSGSLEMAIVPDEFRKDILGEIEDAKHVLVEDAGAEPVHFALLFRFEGDKKAKKHVMYNCVAARPDINGNTKESSVNPETETLSLTASTIYVDEYKKNFVKASSSADTDENVYNTWNTTVHIPTKEA